jgi:hypothetical protein
MPARKIVVIVGNKTMLAKPDRVRAASLDRKAGVGHLGKPSLERGNAGFDCGRKRRASYCSDVAVAVEASAMPGSPDRRPAWRVDAAAT